MDDLSFDELALVLTFLGRQDWLENTDLVNRTFYRASKHIMCWETLLEFKYTLKASSLTSAIKFFSKHHCCPLVLSLSAYGLPRASLRGVHCLSGIRRLTLAHLRPWLASGATALLSSFSRTLEYLSMTDTYELDSSEDDSWKLLELPALPLLTHLHVEAMSLFTLNGLENTPSLTTLDVTCINLEHSSMPPSLTKLCLDADCSQSVLASIANLPNLKHLDATCLDSVLSQPTIAFTHTLHELVYSGHMSEDARANFRQLIIFNFRAWALTVLAM